MAWARAICWNLAVAESFCSAGTLSRHRHSVSQAHGKKTEKEGGIAGGEGEP